MIANKPPLASEKLFLNSTAKPSPNLHQSFEFLEIGNKLLFITAVLIMIGLLGYIVYILKKTKEVDLEIKQRTNKK